MEARTAVDVEPRGEGGPAEDVRRGDVGQRRCHLRCPRIDGRVVVVEVELDTGQVEPAVGGELEGDVVDLVEDARKLDLAVCGCASEEHSARTGQAEVLGSVIVVWQDEEAVVRRFALGRGGQDQIEEEKLLFAHERRGFSAVDFGAVDVEQLSARREIAELLENEPCSELR